MPDGPIRRWIKKTLRLLYLLDVRVMRAYLRMRGHQRYELHGTCQSCAKCCEEPTLLLHPVLFRFAFFRSLTIAWQWHVNRFAFVRAELESRTMVFTCAHFERETRRCDSYDSRPGVCWDYPRYQLDQPWPELHDECGYRAVVQNADALAAALDKTDLSPEVREKLKRKLHVLR